MRVTKYLCVGCRTMWDSKNDARHCCDPEEIQVYECPSCNKWYYYEGQAKNCCSEEHKEESI